MPSKMARKIQKRAHPLVRCCRRRLLSTPTVLRAVLSHMFVMLALAVALSCAASPEDTVKALRHALTRGVRGPSPPDSQTGWAVVFLGSRYDAGRGMTEFRYRVYDSCMPAPGCARLQSWALGVDVPGWAAAGVLRGVSTSPHGAVVWDDPETGVRVAGVAWLSGMETGASETFSVSVPGDAPATPVAAVVCVTEHRSGSTGSEDVAGLRCAAVDVMGPAASTDIADAPLTAPMDGRVSGRVTAALAQGAALFVAHTVGLPAIEVRLSAADTMARFERTARTDSRGDFLFDAVPTGVYVVSAHVSSDGQLPLRVSRDESCPAATSVHVSDAPDAADTTVALCLALVAEALVETVAAPPTPTYGEQADLVSHVHAMHQGPRGTGLLRTEWLRLLRAWEASVGTSVQSHSPLDRSLPHIAHDALHRRSLAQIAREPREKAPAMEAHSAAAAVAGAARVLAADSSAGTAPRLHAELLALRMNAAVGGLPRHMREVEDIVLGLVDAVAAACGGGDGACADRRAAGVAGGALRVCAAVQGELHDIV
eukprot:Opistho-1_new@5470